MKTSISTCISGILLLLTWATFTSETFDVVLFHCGTDSFTQIKDLSPFPISAYSNFYRNFHYYSLTSVLQLNVGCYSVK